MRRYRKEINNILGKAVTQRQIDYWIASARHDLEGYFYVYWIAAGLIFAVITAISNTLFAFTRGEHFFNGFIRFFLKLEVFHSKTMLNML